MRHQSIEFLRKFLANHKVKKVLEIGSMDVNGNIRDVFPKGVNYLGTDKRAGNNVDKVVDGHQLSKHFGEDFDLVICFDTLEHDSKFWLTIKEMKKVLKPEGWLLIATPGRACPLHEHPGDYWRFMQGSFDLFFEDMNNVKIDVEYQSEGYLGNSMEAEIFGWGQKK